MEAFARDQSLSHRKAWQRFNKAVGDSGDVGIWHETFEVRDGHYEVLYGNMPPVGFAKAGDFIPVRNSMRSSSQRRAQNAGTVEPEIEQTAVIS